MHTGDPPPGTHHGGHRMYVTGAGSYFLLIIPLCARGTFLVYGGHSAYGGVNLVV